METSCPICFEKYECEDKSGRLPVTFPCQASHTLCHQCMDKCIRTNNYCPLCGSNALVQIDAKTFRPTVNLARKEWIKWRASSRRHHRLWALMGILLVILLWIALQYQQDQKLETFQTQLRKEIQAQEQNFLKKFVIGVGTAFTTGIGTMYWWTKLFPVHPCAALIGHPILHFACRAIL